MRVFAHVLWLTLKQGGRRVLPLLCCLLAALLALSALPPAPSEPAPLARVGLLLHDQHRLTRVALNALLSPELDGLFELVEVDRADPFPEGCDALLEIPSGFFESIMTGENRPPRLTLRVSSPVEALIARQMALTASSVLGTAQRAVSAVLPRLSAAGLDDSAQDALVLSLDLALFNGYLGRHALLARETLSAAGALDPARHYALSLLVLLLLSLSFLHQPMAAMLRPMARPLGRPVAVLGGWAAGTLLLTALLLASGVALLGSPLALLTPDFWLAVLLLGCVALPLCLVGRSAAGCAGLSIGISTAMGLVGGGFWPPALTPAALLTAGRPLPFFQCVSLLTAALTGGAGPRLPALLWCAGLAALALWLWLRRDRPTTPPHATTRPDCTPPGGFFSTALMLGLKRQLRAPAFWACGHVLLALLGGLAALYPRPQPLSLAVGVVCDADDARASRAVLLMEQNDDFVLRRYTSAQTAAMEQDLRAGRLHCAYVLDSGAPRPVVSLATEDALLRPVSDELMLTSWFEAGVPDQTASLLATALPPETGGAAELARALEQEMAVSAVDGPNVELSSIGTAAPLPEVGLSVAPLLYAVLITAFLLAVALGALCAPADGPRALSLLATTVLPRWQRAMLALSQVLASALLYAGLLLLAEGLLLLCGAAPGYSVAARLLLPLLLAPLGALLGAVFLRCAERPLPLLLMLPIWALVSVLCSGALLDPARLGAFGALRFLSPAWWLLRLMTLLS